MLGLPAAAPAQSAPATKSGTEAERLERIASFERNGPSADPAYVEALTSLKGGMAELDADEWDPDVALVRVADGALEYRGELEPPDNYDEFVKFGGDEGHWRQAGAEMSPELARVLDAPKVIEGEAVEVPAPAPARKGRKKKGPSPE